MNRWTAVQQMLAAAQNELSTFMLSHLGRHQAQANRSAHLICHMFYNPPPSTSPILSLGLPVMQTVLPFRCNVCAYFYRTQVGGAGAALQNPLGAE